MAPAQIFHISRDKMNKSLYQHNTRIPVLIKLFYILAHLVGNFQFYWKEETEKKPTHLSVHCKMGLAKASLGRFSLDT